MRRDGPFLSVSLHDVAPATWERCQRVIAAVAEVAPIPLTLLLVPAYHGQCSAQREFERAMTERLRLGDELALHGYFHRDSQVPVGLSDWLRRRVYTAGEGEFAALSEREAAERLLLGRRWFAANQWPLHGFVAPAWLLGAGAWQALRKDGHFAYTTTLNGFYLLREGRRLRAPCVAYSTRSAWRKGASRVFNPIFSGICAGAPLLRLALHPNDAEFPAIRRSWQRLLERALRDRMAVSKMALADALTKARARIGSMPIPTGTASARPTTTG